MHREPPCMPKLAWLISTPSTVSSSVILNYKQMHAIICWLINPFTHSLISYTLTSFALNISLFSFICAYDIILFSFFLMFMDILFAFFNLHPTPLCPFLPFVSIIFSIPVLLLECIWVSFWVKCSNKGIFLPHCRDEEMTRINPTNTQAHKQG